MKVKQNIIEYKIVLHLNEIGLKTTEDIIMVVSNSISIISILYIYGYFIIVIGDNDIIPINNKFLFSPPSR